MQGHLRLAGAGTAGDEGDTVGGRADRLVLLALDGGDDVAHVLAAFPGQRSEQRALTDHAIDILLGQDLVIERDHLGTFAGDDASTIHAERFAGGGAVERRGSRRTPVHHQRLPVLVANTEPADAVGVAVVEVQPAEDDALLLTVQIGHLGGSAQDHGVAFDQAGQRAGGGAPVSLYRQFPRLRAHDLQAGVDLVDDLLFDGNLLCCHFGHDAPRLVAW